MIVGLLEETRDKSFGNKGRNLAIVASRGIKVPKGILLSQEVYSEFLEPIRERVEMIISTHSSEQAHKKIKKLFRDHSIDKVTLGEIGNKIGNFSEAEYFAVRSSGTAYVEGKLIEEDSERSSLAGQYDSYLKVPKGKLEDAIKLCWASLFNPRSLKSFGTDNNRYSDSKMSVVIQEMIPADKSVVMMTKDPIEKKDIFGIEATYGPCEAIVSGKVTGDLILFDRDNRKILEKELGSKEKRVQYYEFSGNERENYQLVEVPRNLQRRVCISDEEIKLLVDIGLKVEYMFGHPQDIEAVINGQGIYIIQSRNITAFNKSQSERRY